MLINQLICCWLLLAAIIHPLAGQGIEFFNGTYPEAQAKAAAENRFLFVDAGATWCKPCKFMEKEVFSRPEVGEFFNARFVSFKFDIDKGEGSRLKSQLNIQSLPTMLFFRPDGQLAHQVLNGCNPEELIRQARNAIDPNYKLQEQISRYQAGDTSQLFLSELIKNLHGQEQDSLAQTIYPVYWRQLSDKEKQTKAAFEIISIMNRSPRNPQFEYLLAHRGAYQRRVGAKLVHNFIHNSLETELFGFIHRPYPDIQARISKFLALVKTAQAAEYRYFERLTWFNYHSARDVQSPEWLKAADAYLSKHSTEPQELTRCAKILLRFGKTAPDYQKGLAWVQKGLKISPSAEAMAVKAWLLYKLNRLAAAQKAAKLSLERYATEQKNPAYVQELIKLLPKP